MFCSLLFVKVEKIKKANLSVSFVWTKFVEQVVELLLLGKSAIAINNMKVSSNEKT